MLTLNFPVGCTRKPTDFKKKCGHDGAYVNNIVGAILYCSNITDIYNGDSRLTACTTDRENNNSSRALNFVVNNSQVSDHRNCPFYSFR